MQPIIININKIKSLKSNNKKKIFMYFEIK